MKLAFKPCSVIFAIAIIASFARVSWCQTCGTKAYGGSPSVDFYATKSAKTPRPQHMERFQNAVTVQPGSNITLVCTAMEPMGFPSYLRSYLQPYLIYWFVNSSLIRVPNCDKTPRKAKTCSLSLANIKPSDHGKYFCQAANELGCTYKHLQLSVTSGNRNQKKPGILNRGKIILNKFKRQG